MTFSIVAIDAETRTCGSAVASFSLAVGGTVSYSRIGVGVINTQHFAHLALGQRVLDEIDHGKAPHEALSGILRSDPDAESRQLIAIDATGRQGGWTGRDCAGAKRHMFGTGCVAAGNFLASEEVVEGMVDMFERTAGEAVGDRLLQALQAGESLGGDRRGRMAAALSVTPSKGSEVAVNLDLRVDCHADPIGELSRIRELFRREFRQ
jgi:uncharacterized Ntn-hydrolase superfamily protein